MPSAFIKKKIKCKKKELIKIVLDIEKYPEFVPWCIKSKVHEKNEKGDKLEIIADLTIGKSFIKDTYKSFVVFDKSKDSIHVTNIGGPLKYLDNKWYFKELKKLSEVEFHIDFELKNKILNTLMLKYFEASLRKIVDKFEERAISTYSN